MWRLGNREKLGEETMARTLLASMHPRSKQSSASRQGIEARGRWIPPQTGRVGPA